MTLSAELIAHTGSLLAREVRETAGSQHHAHARRMQLAWVRAIEAAYREDERRAIDADSTPYLLRKQAG